MRQFRPQAKEQRRIPIPEELRQSLRSVHDLIQQAQYDPEIILDYDDAIQTDSLCGGRVGTQDRPYLFTYFPEGDVDRGKWSLNLNGAEIEDIADGVIKDMRMYCCVSPECHCKFREKDENCFYCDYQNDEATKGWEQRLKEMARAAQSKEDWVRAYLRENPNAFGMSMIGDFNSIPGLGDRLGWFTLQEAEKLINRLR